MKKNFISLLEANPSIAQEWHPTKNGNLTPANVAAFSNKNVWWYLPYDVPNDYPVEHLRGKHFNFEWKATISSRNNYELKCPYLSGRAIWVGFNDLATVNPRLTSEWHPTKNGSLKPSDITANSGKKVWWLLPYDVPNDYLIEHLRGKHFNFEWQARITDRNKGIGCPFLSGQDIWKGFNDLKTTHPDIAEEWHPIKNGDLKPDMFTAGSNVKVWWLLLYTDPKTGMQYNLEWQAKIIDRALRGQECPYFSGKVKAGFNDLETTHPELAKEWHPYKNGNLTPADVSAGSHRKVWWYLPYDDPKTGKHFNFEWEAAIKHRNNGCGCPFLSESKGEQYIKKYLSNNELTYNCEETFDNLKGIGGRLLSYDFYIKETKILIEYQGIQHYEPIEYFGGEKKFTIQKEHDKRKREYAKSHGYKLIEISYKYDTYEKIEEYLDKKLKLLLNKYNLNTK